MKKTYQTPATLAAEIECDLICASLPVNDKDGEGGGKETIKDDEILSKQRENTWGDLW